MLHPAGSQVLHIYAAKSVGERLDPGSNDVDDCDLQ